MGRAWKRLTTDDVETMRFGLLFGMSCCELAEMYDVCHQTISKIKKGVTYSWL